MRVSICFMVVLALAFFDPSVIAKKNEEDPQECEVCMEVLEAVDVAIPKEKKKDRDFIEGAIDTFCKSKELTSKQKKMCYYIEPIKKSVSQPFSLKLPKKKVCQRLKKDNPEICDIKNSVKVQKEASAQDVTKLRVKQLKAILAARGVECEGCLEKNDFVARVLETAHMEDL
mmetsp:Transcript_61036/g.119699  ORF Transcript_61036/g.119699 Transcript_61036/m.119699 type:complete len:172 (+) Transcript_61036:45-560(+)|eukprot:CAMPEP_0171620614 /NCGR_PEP_ID=MMETSP0990-20121206/16097_1 /TAXON_ID=483369 /ORGANISM="non described non described, Strain CCMP2098" /LENGTH=171 /DNA_ID=CAMNT_0012185943 /DNA_START=19 /DNA_END=534 /DNA_ORIENTATION=+